VLIIVIASFVSNTLESNENKYGPAGICAKIHLNPKTAILAFIVESVLVTFPKKNLQN
jgi:hypothetical protein